MAGNKPVKVHIAASGVSKFQRAMGNAGRSMQNFGKMAGLAVGGAVVAGGAALLKIGSDFDAMNDTIRVGTGATGDALAALEQSAKNVASTTPAAFGDVGTAIADLNTRTGLVGEPLEALSEQMLELSRLTGTDLSSNIESVTRVFGDWGIAAEDQGDSLDFLFRASQATGIEVGRLSDQMVQYGAPLRQFGFSAEQAAVLLGKFEKEGVNAELVMGSLRQGLGKLAKSGEEPVEAFKRVTEEIANAGDASEANALAMELFGARAGPDMAAAIREGRFSIEELWQMVAEGEDTIVGVGDQTASMGEKFTELKNKVFVALEPLATKLFDGLSSAMGWLLPVIDGITAAFAEGGLRGAIDHLRERFSWLEDWAMRNKPILAAIAAVIATLVVGAVWALVAGLLALLSPVVVIGAAIAALAAGFVWAYENVDWFRTAVDAVASFMTDTLWPILQDVFFWMRDNVPEIIGAIIGFFVGFKDRLGDVVGAVVGFFRRLWEKGVEAKDFLVGAFTAVKDAITSTKDWISDRVDDVVGFFTGIPGRIAGIFEGIFDGLPNAFKAGVNVLIGLLNDFSFSWDSKKIAGFTVFPGGSFDPFNIPLLADGGRLTQGGAVMVGERGPEMLNLPRGAQVTPLDRPGVGGIVVNVSSNASPYQIGREVAWATRTAGF